jgi:hypothetical protein
MMKPVIFSAYDTSGFPKILADQNTSVSLTQDRAFNFEDKSDFKVFHQIEPPEVTDIVDALIEHQGFYDLILAWNEKILASCPKAKLFPLGCCSWIPWNDAGANFNHAKPADGSPHVECDASKKEFKVSYLTSDKNWTPGHILRQGVFDSLPAVVGSIPVTKHRSPPWIADKRDFLYPYQFTVSPLNASHDNWFDDKMIDPLIAKTIPLIWGLPNIGQYFNMDGIIVFQTIPEMLERMAELTPDYYAKHFDAVMDNYRRALVYTPVWTRVDEEITKALVGKTSSRNVLNRVPDKVRRPVR